MERNKKQRKEIIENKKITWYCGLATMLEYYVDVSFWVSYWGYFFELSIYIGTSPE